jgi:hypothetical protein
VGDPTENYYSRFSAWLFRSCSGANAAEDLAAEDLAAEDLATEDLATEDLATEDLPSRTERLP